MEPCSTQNQYKFFKAVLEALHIQADSFMYNVYQHCPYELLLYVWIDKLYTKGKPIEEAIQLIYKARNIYLIHSNNTLCNPL